MVGYVSSPEGRIVVGVVCLFSLFVLANLEEYGFRFFETGQCLFEFVCLYIDVEFLKIDVFGGIALSLDRMCI